MWCAALKIKQKLRSCATTIVERKGGKKRGNESWIEDTALLGALPG